MGNYKRIKLEPMSEKEEKKVKLTPTSFKILNFAACGLIIFANVLRFFVSEKGDDGIDGTPLMLFFIQTILTIMHALFVICGELFCPPVLLANYPLLVSRMGRGAIIILIALP